MTTTQDTPAAGKLMPVEQCELLPCPFCGGEAMEVHVAEPSVECTLCPVGMLGSTETDAIARWNTRSSPSSAAPDETCELCGGACLRDSDKPLPAWVTVEERPSAAPDAGEVERLAQLAFEVIEYRPPEGPPWTWEYAVENGWDIVPRLRERALAALGQRTQSLSDGRDVPDDH
jgi:hypothetical protein